MFKMSKWKSILGAICCIVFFAEAENGATTVAEFSPNFDINFLLTPKEEQKKLSENEVQEQNKRILRNLHNKAKTEALSDSEIKVLINFLFKKKLSNMYSRKATIILLEASRHKVFSLDILKEMYSMVADHEKIQKIHKQLHVLQQNHIRNMFINILTKQMKYFGKKDNSLRFLLLDNASHMLREIISNKSEDLIIRVSAMNMLKERWKINLIPYKYYIYLERTVLNTTEPNSLRGKSAEALIEGIKAYKVKKGLHRHNQRFRDLVLNNNENSDIRIAVMEAMVALEKNNFEENSVDKLNPRSKNILTSEVLSFTTLLSKIIYSKEADIVLRRTTISSFIDLVTLYPNLFINDPAIRQKVKRMLKYIAYRNSTARNLVRSEAKQILNSFYKNNNQTKTSLFKKSINYVKNRCQKAF